MEGKRRAPCTVAWVAGDFSIRGSLHLRDGVVEAGMPSPIRAIEINVVISPTRRVVNPKLVAHWRLGILGTDATGASPTHHAERI